MAVTGSAVAAFLFSFIWVCVRLVNFFEHRAYRPPPATPGEVRLWAILSLLAGVAFAINLLTQPQ